MVFVGKSQLLTHAPQHGTTIILSAWGLVVNTTDRSPSCSPRNILCEQSTKGFGQWTRRPSMLIGPSSRHLQAMRRQ